MKTKIIILSVIGVMFLALPFSKAQNILTDGDFSTTTEILPWDGWNPSNVWCYWIDWDASGYASVVDGICNYEVYSVGYYTWSLQLVQAGFPLEPGHRYRFSFDAKADGDRTFGVFLGENWGNWTNLIGNENYSQNATTEWQTFTFEFNMACNYYYYKMSLELGLTPVNMYFDNVMLEDLGLYESSVGILGTSVDGWDVDHDMMTDDGIIYYLLDFPLVTGEVKFRQDDSWCLNWGGETFPSGTGFQDGPNIIIVNGSNYDITFNRLTGEYSFVCVNNCHPYLGINGSAVPPEFGFGPDVNMVTNDGVTYQVDHYFTDGEAKFYQDDLDEINWGGSTFPAGTASPGSPPIPVTMGLYHVTFNLTTLEYNFGWPSVGILGTSLTGWNDDIDMQTTDGIVYTLTDYPFSYGEVKFRVNDSWVINWGSWYFPAGYAWQDGPNILVSEGQYDVTININTGEYSFVATTCPVPGIQCPYYPFGYTDPGMCSGVVFYEVVPAPYCGGDGLVIQQTEGLPSGSEFPAGYTTNTFMLTNADGNTATCSFDVYVYDWEPPVMTGLTDEFEPLWPPNHQMVPIHIDYELEDNCSATYSYLYVYSNEPESGLGDGDLAPDWIIYDEHNLDLRAERSGTGDGRIYYIYIVYYDENWNYNYALVTVEVPHDKGKTKDGKESPGIIEQPGNEGRAANYPFSVEIWPNPSTSDFNISVKSESDEAIRVFITDLTGRLVSDFIYPDGQPVTFGDRYQPGVYLLHAKQGSVTKTFKIVKQ
jgi:hypothetical protein